jgi:cell division protein FtsW
MTKPKKIDKFFLTVLLLLVGIGLAVFISAALGILVKDKNLFYSVLFTQIVQGLGVGFLGMYLCLKIDYKFWRKYAFYIFLASILLTAAVFIPHIGWAHGGAQRWIKIGPITFQPVEFLKIGFVIYFAAWLSWARNKIKDFKFGILPFVVLLGIIAVVLFKQPDTKSFILITVTGAAMLLMAGIPWKYVISAILGITIVLGCLVAFTPYLQDRVKTFIDPSQDPRGASFQIQQSLIAVGSGGILGRGLGQSIQKFSYLPEPQGDSIFAVVGEELGFVGSVIIIILYVIFALRGLYIANRSPDQFSRLFVAGIVILILAQSFMNIASTIGVFPLTGVPLAFMSHGGTSLMIYLATMGIVLQISKHQRKTE